MIFAMSDIHGSLDALLRASDLIAPILDNSEDKIAFLGDYIDRGPDSAQVLEYIYELQKNAPEDKVIVLRGNHDNMFLSWLKNKYDTLHLANDITLTTVKSFLRPFYEDWDSLVYDGQFTIYNSKNYLDVTKDVIGLIHSHYKELLEWYQELPYFYEEDDTLFVHAGFDEIPGSNWADSSEETMVWQYPAQYGYTPWNKVVIAGHIMTRELNPAYCPDELKDKIFRNKDHIYIDGAACVTGTLNVLIADTKKGQYYDAWTHEIISE